MAGFCEHKFITAGEWAGWEKTSKKYDSFFVLKNIKNQRFFLKEYNETRGIYNLVCNPCNGLIFIKGIEKDVYEFLEQVKEADPDFEYELNKVVDPIIVFDPDCKECNEGLDISFAIRLGL